MTDQTLSSVAGDAYGWFETRTRFQDEPGRDAEDYVTLKDEAPEWLRDLVREAHGEFLPDDWRYESIRAALGFIHDNDAESEDDLNELQPEFADSMVDPYSAARTEWLASNLQRVSYCDEAWDEGLVSQGSILSIIAAGQYVEAQEVFASVSESLLNHFASLVD